MIRVLVAGLGNMGRSHALAYHRNPGFEICGFVNRSETDLPAELTGYPLYVDFETALTATKPDLVAVCTYTDSHAAYAILAMQAGADVFVEKPLAATAAQAQSVVDTAKACGRKLVVGYILRHHPSWQSLIAEARDLGGPYVFRLNLNQQSSGPQWTTHKSLMQTTSPIVDCGVHYVDVMCQITDALPVEVRGMGLRLSDEIAPDMYNYGQFQVLFADGSIGWYEAGWGPMISETAYFVKDILSPNGSVSIVETHTGGSADIDSHTRVGALRIHLAKTGADGVFSTPDRIVDLPGEPGHQALCESEQAFVLNAITGDLDLTRHMGDAVQSLRICLAADESIRTKKPIDLTEWSKS
jgi:predicted dehydrogenase